MNQAHKALEIYEISSGGITGTIVDLRLIFSAALKANARSLMMLLKVDLYLKLTLVWGELLFNADKTDHDHVARFGFHLGYIGFKKQLNKTVLQHVHN